MSISEKDFNVLCGKLSPNEELIFRNLSILGIEKNNDNKTERREGINTKRDKINSNNLINKKMKYSTLRGAGQFELLIEKASCFQLDLKDFPMDEYKGELPKIKKKFGMKNLFSKNKEDDEEKKNFGTLIFFNIGGLCRNEIYALEKLVKPIIVTISTPITGITFGLFYFVINAFILKLTDWIMGPKLDFTDIWALFVISIVLALLNLLIEKLIIEPIIRKASKK